MIIDNLSIGLVFLIIIVCVIGYYLKVLTLSGVIAAMLVGISIQIGFGMKGLILLGLFFGSSSVWSKFQQSKKKLYQEKLEKGERRDYVQVLANGGISALISLFAIIYPASIWLFIFMVCLASANADTWASEIGSLSKSKPFFITTLKRVDAGTSGAVSLLGIIAAMAGAFLIAFSGLLLWNQLSFKLLLIITLLGFIGNLIDTLLGALFQVKYICEQCQLETEKTYHCNRPTVKSRGISCLNNDVVNFLSILLAGFLTIFFI